MEMRILTPALSNLAFLIVLLAMTGCGQPDVQKDAIELRVGIWSEPFDLKDHDPAADPLNATVRLRPNPTELEFDLIMDPFEPTSLAPWQNGNGVFVSVIKPGSESYFEEFAFGLFRAEVPIGAIRIADSWQPVVELTPEIGIDPASKRLRLTFAIPWSICGNLHPLVDTEMSLNVASVRQGGARAFRFADPIRWRWPSEEGPAVHGRPADMVVTGDILNLEPLALVATDDAPAKVTFVLRDSKGGIRHQASWTLRGPAGRRERRGGLPFDMPAGSVTVEARYGDGSVGKTVSWQADLVSLPGRWMQSAADRIAALPARERPSLRYRLDALLAEAEVRHPLDNPVALGMTIHEIDHLLDLHARTGTTLPAGGNYIAAMPGREDLSNLLCSLSLPDGWQRGDPAHVLLLMLRATGGQTQAVMQAPALLDDLMEKRQGPPPSVIVAIPHLTDSADHGADTALTIEIMDWLQDFLDCGPIHLAAVDLLAAAALEVAGIERDRLAGVLMITGMNFTPYPEDDPAWLAARFAELDPNLPAGWIWFPDEQRPGDQARPLRHALRSVGLNLRPSRAVQGDLTFDQAWQRALHWVVQPTP
jgi:hypothetical protein